MAELRNDDEAGLSEYWDIADEGREADENERLGTGIIDRLGGRGGCLEGVETALVADVDSAGEKARCMEPGLSPSSFHPASDCRPDIERHWVGAGIQLGVLGRGRGVVDSPGV